MDHYSDETKRAYALELIKNPNNPFEAALALFPNDTGHALRMSREWLSDPVVVEEKARILGEQDEMDFLPGKATLCRAIWEKMTASYVAPDDFVKMARLYADVRGMIPKQGAAELNVNVNELPRVMAYRDLGSNEDWEAAAEKQQKELLNVSTSKH